MSEVKIVIKKLSSGFSKVYIDNKYCGTLEDTGDIDSVAEVINQIIKLGCIENTIVIEEPYD